MNDYLSEDEQIDQIRKWWSENGKFIVSGVALGIAGLVGWNWHSATRERASVDASAVYARLAEAVETGSTDQAIAAQNELLNDYSGTPYAAMSRLAAARLHMDNGQGESAVRELEALLQSDAPVEVRLVARLRLARALLYLERADEALAVVNGAEPGGFQSRFDEVRGDIEFALGNRDAARQAWRAALDDPGSPPLVDLTLLQMKLADLGPAADISAAAESAEPVQ